MSRLKKFQEKHKQMNRFQALKSIFSSFVLTVTAVVVVVVAVPNSPKASIDNLEAFNNVITYTVNVTDSDSAIIDDTLQVVLENQYYEYYQEIDIGSSTGVFEDLEHNTEYNLKVVADKGFGLEVLDSETVTTEVKTGGIIIRKDLISEDEWSYSYNIDFLVNDPHNEYQDFQIRYGFKYQGEDEVFSYQTSLSLLNEESYILENVSKGVEVYIYLEAINNNLEIIILDELIFNTPFEISTYFYAERISNDSVSFYVFDESFSDVLVEYEVLLKQHDFIIDRAQVVFPDNIDEFHHSGASVEFDELHSDMEYHAVLLAKYIDPYTLEYKEVETQEIVIQTLTDFEISLEIDEFDTYLEVTVFLGDEFDTYDEISYLILEIDDTGTWIYESMSYTFEVVNDQKYATFIIDLPALDEMIIEIHLNDTTDFSHFIMLERINKTEEVT